MMGWMIAMVSLGCFPGGASTTALEPQADANGKTEVELTYDASVFPGPFTGRVHVLWLSGDQPSLPRMPNWFAPFPHHFVEVKDWKPGEPLKIGPDAKGYPNVLGKLAKAKRTPVAVMDRDLGGISFAASEGNVWGVGASDQFDTTRGFQVKIKLDRVYKSEPFKETDRMKLVRIRSERLSAFHKKDQFLQAAVVVPESFDAKRSETYPLLLEIPGFGGDHNGARKFTGPGRTKIGDTDFVCVMLDPNCRLGHHSFADSANNGPVGEALTKELIPAIEERFHCGGTRNKRLLTGHSSGGWSSMWLMTSYPEVFGGTWSTAPDPTDFHDFQKVDLYAPGANIFREANGTPRPLSRGPRPILYEEFYRMEEPMKRGGQLQTFQAVFGPRGADGFPVPLWDDRGEIDPKVFEHWKPYDIAAKLQKQWPEKGHLYKGRIHVYCGTLDTFLLEGAAMRLKEVMAKLDPTSVVEMIEGRNHGNVVDRALMQKIHQDMAATAAGQKP